MSYYHTPAARLTDPTVSKSIDGLLALLLNPPSPGIPAGDVAELDVALLPPPTRDFDVLLVLFNSSRSSSSKPPPEAEVELLPGDSF